MEASTAQCLTLKAYAEIYDTEAFEFEISVDGKKADDTSWPLHHSNIFDLDTVVTLIEIPDGTYRLSIDIVFKAPYLFIHELILSPGQCDHNTFRKFVS